MLLVWIKFIFKLAVLEYQRVQHVNIKL